MGGGGTLVLVKPANELKPPKMKKGKRKKEAGVKFKTL